MCTKKIASFLFFVFFVYTPYETGAVFIDLTSTSMRNARWLSENRLNWYHSYVPDVLKMLSAGVSADDDDQKPGFDPGSIEDIELRLRALCPKANKTFVEMNLSRDCASDLHFLICSGARLAIALQRLSSNYCKKQAAPEACHRKLQQELQTHLWTSKYLDSFGKVAGGWLSGNYMHFGSYQQCTQLHVKRPITSRHQDDFNGKFCYATLSLPLSPTRAKLATTCYGRNITQACAPASDSYTVKWGFCAPESCSIPEANGVVAYALSSSNITFCPAKPLVMCVEATDFTSDKAAIVTTILCAVLIVIIAVGTAYDLMQRKILTREWLGCFEQNLNPNRYASQRANPTPNSIEMMHEEDQKRWYLKLLSAFSLYTNLGKLFDTDDNRRKSTRCLDGIRVLTMSWIVLAESVVLAIDYIGNIAAYLKLPAVLSFQFINNSSFSTDTFFFIAGFLIAWPWLQNTSNQRERESSAKKATFAVLRRLFRWLPVYMFILGVSTVFWAHIGDGPMWIAARYSHASPIYCGYTWWTNLLFVNNFFYVDHACMPWTWHVAVDAQLYLLAIPILILYRKRPLAGFLVSAVLVVLSVILTGIIVASYALPPSLVATTDLSRYESINDYYNKIFIKPYMRWNPYLIGIFVSYIVNRSKNNRDVLGIKYLRLAPVNTAAWAAVVVVCSVLIYGLHNFASGNQMTSMVVIAYASLSRTIWSLAIGVLILLCLRTKGGLVKWFLSWSLWTPLSRLTYCAFLLHALSILFFYGSSKEWFELTLGNVIYFWLSSLIVSYGLGLVAYVCVEAPGITIGQVLFGTSSTTSDDAPSADSFKLLELDARTNVNVKESSR